MVTTALMGERMEIWGAAVNPTLIDMRRQKLRT